MGLVSNFAWPSAHQLLSASDSRGRLKVLAFQSQVQGSARAIPDLGRAIRRAKVRVGIGPTRDVVVIEGTTQTRDAHDIPSDMDSDRVFGALADHTRRDIVRRAISAKEGVLELASHYPMSFAAVQKHVAVLERAGLITKQRIGRRRVVRTNLEALLVARRLLDQYEELWRARIDRMNELIAETAGAIDTVETKESKR